MIKNCRIVDDSGRILEPYQVFWRFQDLIPESKYDVTLQFGSGLFDKHGEELHAYTDANDIEKIG
jgi:hypothetical protein